MESGRGRDDARRATRALGRPVHGEHRDREGDPGPASLAAQRGAGHRVARGRARARRRGAGWGSRARTGRTRRCSPTPTSTPSTSRCPTTCTRAWTIAAARAGKHVLCEKPLAMTAAEAQGMVDACRDAGVLLMEAFMYRQHPSWVAVRDLVASGRIGRSRRSTAGSRTSTTTRPTSATSARPAAARCTTSAATRVNLSRMLFGAEPVARPGGHHARPGPRRRRADQRDPRVPDGRRDVHLLHPDRDRPAGPRLRHGGPDLGRDPVQHPARPPDPDLRHGRRRPAGRAGDRDARRSTRPIPMPARPTGSPTRCSTASRCRSSPRTPSPTCG